MEETKIVVFEALCEIRLTDKDGNFLCPTNKISKGTLVEIVVPKNTSEANLVVSTSEALINSILDQFNKQEIPLTIHQLCKSYWNVYKKG